MKVKNPEIVARVQQNSMAVKDPRDAGQRGRRPIRASLRPHQCTDFRLPVTVHSKGGEFVYRP